VQQPVTTAHSVTPRTQRFIAPSAWPATSGEYPIRRVGNQDIFLGVLAGLLRNSMARRLGLRRLVADLWNQLKCYGASSVRSIELWRVNGIERAAVIGPAWRHTPLVFCALANLLRCQKVFMFGTDVGDTALLLAHNLPSLRIYTLGPEIEGAVGGYVQPTDGACGLSREDRRDRADETHDADGITQLRGDPDTFDLLAHSETADLVYISASLGVGCMKSSTEAAFGLLSERGTIVWEDYPDDVGIYGHLNQLAPSLDRPVFHLVGTRLALYSRWDIIAAAPVIRALPCERQPDWAA